MKRFRIEGLDGILIMSRYKDHLGDSIWIQVVQELKCIKSGHFNVEKDQVRRELAYQVQGFRRCSSLADYFAIFVFLESNPNPFAGQFDIIDDHRWDHACELLECCFWSSGKSLIQ